MRTLCLLLALFLLMFQTTTFAVLVTEGSKLPDVADTLKGKDAKKNPPQDKPAEEKKEEPSAGVVTIVKDEKLPASAQTASPLQSAVSTPASNPAAILNNSTVVTQPSVQGSAGDTAAKK